MRAYRILIPAFALLSACSPSARSQAQVQPPLPEPVRMTPVSAVAMNGLNLRSQPLTAESLQAADCVVIATDHTSFDWDFISANARLVIDTRNALKGRSGAARIIRL